MKHSEQLRAWAIDRAIETLKTSSPSAETIIETAEKYVAYAAGPDVEDEAEPEEGSVQ